MRGEFEALVEVLTVKGVITKREVLDMLTGFAAVTLKQPGLPMNFLPIHTKQMFS